MVVLRTPRTKKRFDEEAGVLVPVEPKVPKPKTEVRRGKPSGLRAASANLVAQEKAHAPLVGIRSLTPNGLFSDAWSADKGLGPDFGKTEFGQRVQAVFAENPSMFDSASPDFGPLLLEAQSSGVFNGTPIGEELPNVIARYYPEIDGVRQYMHFGLVCPNHRDLGAFVADSSVAERDENDIYLRLDDSVPEMGGRASVFVRLKPEFEAVLKEHFAGFPESLDPRAKPRPLSMDMYLELIARKSDGSGLLVAKKHRILAQRWIANVDMATVRDTLLATTANSNGKGDSTKTAGLRKQASVTAPTVVDAEKTDDFIRASGSASVRLDPKVKDVLSRASVEGSVIKLPGQLECKLYSRVDSILKLLGGEWNRGKGGHLFQEDPSAILATALESGTVEDVVKKFQFYATPETLAEEMAVLACIGPKDLVLEPHGGSGRIAKKIDNGNLEVCELNSEMAKDLADQGYNVVAGDFLSFQPGAVYDRIVANPPFTRGQDVAHTQHMLDCLKPGGRLVTIVSGGVDYRTDRATLALRARLVNECPGHTLKPLESGTFKDSGTMVNSLLLVADKAKA